MSAKLPPKPSKDVIYVDVDDEITSIIDKVENSPEKVVALVLPKRAASLQSTVNMKLLARSAKSAGKNPVLITSESSLMPLAGVAGLHVAKNLQSKPEIPDLPPGMGHKSADDTPAEEIPEDATDDEEAEDEANEDDNNLPRKIAYGAAGIGALAAAHDADNPETIDLDDEDEVDSKKSDEPEAKATKKSKIDNPKVPNFDRFRMMLGAGGLALIALIVFIILAVTVLPKATITIATTSEPVSASFNLNASTTTTALDTKTGAIPAVLQKTDQTGTQSVSATGQQNNGEKATGSVTLTNCSNSATTVPAGTGVSSSGVTFITQKTVSLDSGNFTSGGVCKSTGTHVGSTDITAQSAGSKYNVSSGAFTVAGYSGVSGSGSTSGGTDNNVTVVSQGDVEGAVQKLTSGTAAADFTKAWEKKLTDGGEYVITSTLKATDPAVVSTPAVGQPASTATVTVKVTYTVLTVKKTDLTAALNAQLASQIDPKKQKLSDSSLSDAAISVQSQTSANSATLSVSIDTTAVPIIDVNNVKKIAKGKKTGDITVVINNWPGVKAVDVKLSPFWVSKVPNKESKITVVLKEVKTSTKDDSGQP